jgi:ubiquinone/menaquinone biosynthesis C-methylase UbiE
MTDSSGVYLATGFRNVDTTSEVGKLVSCLQFMDGLNSFQDYKQEIINRVGLESGMSVLDIGCGIGFDETRISGLVGRTGSVIGLDPSAALIDYAHSAKSAQGSNVRFVRGIGEQLPFRDNTFDVCRVDRTLQHVSDPGSVIAEMYRVLKPSGRIACAEPDWGTFVVTSDDRPTTRSVIENWCDGFRNGWVGRYLQPSLKGVGFAAVKVTGHLLIAEGFKAIDKVFDVSMTVARMRDHYSDGAALDEWLLRLRDKTDSLASVTLFLATGVKPYQLAKDS